MKEMLEKLGDPRAAVASDDPVSEADKNKAIPSEGQYLKQQEDKKDLSFGDSVESRMSDPPEGEMTMKEMLEKLGDPRAAVASDDPVSEADKNKAIPSEGQYLKQQEDKKDLFESLDRAEALAKPKAGTGTTKVDPALADALEEETGPDMEAMLTSLKGEDPTDEKPAAEPEAAEPEAAEPEAAEPEAVDVSGAPKAVPVVPDDESLLLFDAVHGKGSFDPNSSMDLGKLAEIKKNLIRDEYKGLTPEQFALKMYREAA